MLDPLVYRYLDTVNGYSSLLNFAARAPRLEVELHADFPSFVTECLVRAVDLRLRRLTDAQLNAETGQRRRGWSHVGSPAGRPAA